jgi:hypothetical protein
VNQTCSFRGSKSRNKVSVGEPAEGSLTLFFTIINTNEHLSEPLGCRRSSGEWLDYFSNPLFEEGLVEYASPWSAVKLARQSVCLLSSLKEHLIERRSV